MSSERDPVEPAKAEGEAELHSLLLRQMGRLGLFSDAVPSLTAWQNLLARVSRAYTQADEGRYLMEHSQSLVSAEMVALNKALRVACDKAEQMARVKSEFLADMSHEIRTPMNAIIGMSQLALKTSMDKGQSYYLDNIHQAAQHLLRIINDIQDFSKIEAGKLKLERIDFAIVQLLEETVLMLQERAQQKGLELTLAVDPGVPAHIVGDPTRLRQVLINLIGNAIKFTETGGVRVTVNVLQDPAGLTTSQAKLGDLLKLRFAVTDTGIGLKESAQRNLFQKFYQADASTSREFGGTGLGLSICKQIVEQLMGGTIGVTSLPGQGSVFFFEVSLPVGQKLSVEDAYVVRPHAQQLRVLVAEDGQTNQIVIESFLKQMGHHVTLAENGELALYELLSQPFDLILMDGRMPVMDGSTATQFIRSGRWGELTFNDPHIPIVALTANTSQSDRLGFLAAGMDDFLTKPIDEVALHKALQRVIDQRRCKRLGVFA